MTCDHSETLAQLGHARKVLQSQLAHAEFDDKLTDSAINTTSLIVRTLEIIDQLSRAQRLGAKSIFKSPYQSLVVR